MEDERDRRQDDTILGPLVLASVGGSREGAGQLIASSPKHISSLYKVQILVTSIRTLSI